MDLERKDRPLVGVFTTDTDLVVRVWDDAMKAMTDLAAGDVVGKNLSEIVPDIDSRGLLRRFELVLEHGATEVLAPALHKFLIKCRTRSPSRHFTEMRQLVTISALSGADGVQGLMVVVEDVTERMGRERELAERLGDADESVRLQAAKAFSSESEVISSDTAEPVINALGDKSWRVRRRLVDGLARRSAPDAVTALLAAVREDHLDFGMLNSALQVLQATSVDTTDTLVEFLKNDDPDLRIQAALALGQQNKLSAVPHLIDALGDENANVRYHAVEALGKMKAAAAVEAILAIAESRDFFLSFAALDALKAIGDRSAAVRVASLLDDELLCEAAAGTLGAVGDAEAVAPIIKLMNDGLIPAPAAAGAVCELYDRYEEESSSGELIAARVRESIGESGTSALAATLGDTGGRNIESIRMAGWVEDPRLAEKLASLIDHEAVRDAAVEALARHGGAAVYYFAYKLDIQDAEVRKSAAGALGAFDSDDAVDALIAAIHNDPGLAPAAVQALSGSTKAAAADTLIDLLASEDALVRRSAVSTLKTMLRPEILSRLCGLLTDVDPNVREAVVRIVAEQATPECREAVLSACDDPDEVVRVAAVEQLSGLSGRDAFEKLVSALTDGAPRVRAAAAKALGKSGGDEAKQALRAALADPDAWTRYFAIRSLAELGDAVSLSTFVQMAERDDAEQVRAAAAEAVGKIGI